MRRTDRSFLNPSRYRIRARPKNQFTREPWVPSRQSQSKAKSFFLPFSTGKPGSLTCCGDTTGISGDSTSVRPAHTAAVRGVENPELQ